VNPCHVATPHDASPEQALGEIRRHRGPIVLDLDETLYLRNSTEDFIDSARPRLMALLLLRLLDALRPWRWTGGDVTRDVWRVRLIVLCFPHTLVHWRTRVVALAAAFCNLPLLAAVRAPGTTPVIATAGFLPIVAPLVAALGLPQVRIVAARIWRLADRRRGKLHLARGALGDDMLRQSLVITDSADDLALLDACARPLRTVWPEARFRAALGSVYLPGQYLTQVKRPGSRYIVRGILQEDFAFWVLSSVALAAMPLMHVLGLLLLLVSFWAIYERGYVDNDLVAARFEAAPKLSNAFHDAPVATPVVQPWVWALLWGVGGVLALRWPERPSMLDLLIWALVLVATHAWFTLYNRFDKSTRVWLFGGLQFARATAFAALVPVTPIGAAAIGAHVLARWVPYHVYRLAGGDWPEAPIHLMRLFFFAVLAMTLGLTQGGSGLFDATALSLLAWNLYRARRELAEVWKAASRLDRPLRKDSS
jgi:hypothetical protein